MENAWKREIPNVFIGMRVINMGNFGNTDEKTKEKATHRSKDNRHYYHIIELNKI